MKNKVIVGFILFYSSFALALPVVVIDPGHEPSRLGSIGTCQINEVDYNDKMVKQIEHQLAPAYHIILTRKPFNDVNIHQANLAKYIPANEHPTWEKSKSLLARPAIANRHNADVFIAIHHDSVSAKQQIINPKLCQGHGGKQINPEFTKKYHIGYNIFINNDDNGARRINSLKLAKQIAKQLLAIGRRPSNYHVYPDDDCKSCYPVNKNLGIWHENLAVLRGTTMPAVLIEVGNIIDPTDEKIINNNAFRKKFSLALKKGLDAYFKEIE